ncbi:MAG: glycosyltransferase, partial [Chitinophagales bacterium]|nr:glycosyltransferase [Chitinophagales bacterium]
MSLPGISIVFVHYKTPQLLLNAIDSVVEYTKGCNYEIIVVDNYSQDDSQKMITDKHPHVRWFSHSYNAGFARGNNLGISLAKFDYVLIINSDILLREDAISKSFEKYCELEKIYPIGLFGCKIISFEGQTLPSVHNHHTTIFSLLKKNAFWIKLFGEKSNRIYNASWYNTNHFAEHLSGAFLLFNKKRLNQKDLLLDEDFFLYYEDVEWCLRLYKKGFRHFYFAETYILHKDSGSTTVNIIKQRQILVSELLFIYKCYPRWYFILYYHLMIFNLNLDNF